MSKHDPFEFKAADAQETFDNLPNKKVMAEQADEGIEFITWEGPGDSMTVRVGGAEVEIAVIDGELCIGTQVPGDLDPTVFRINERFGTATVVFRHQSGKPFSYKDLHPRNRDAR